MGGSNSILRLANWVMVMASVLAGLSTTAVAQDISLHGYIEPQVRAKIGSKQMSFTDAYQPFMRAELNSYIDDSLRVFSAAEINVQYQNSFADAISLDLKEMYGEIYTSIATVRFGRQIFTWGSNEDISPIDVLNPQELIDLGQNSAQRKLGVLAASVDFEAGPALIQFVVMPRFRASIIDSKSPFAKAVDPPPLLQSGIDEWSRQGNRALQQGRNKLVNGIEAVEDGYNQVTQGIIDLDNGYAQINDGIDDLDEALKFLNSAGDSIPDASQPDGQLTYEEAIKLKLELLDRQQRLLHQRDDLQEQKAELAAQQKELTAQLAQVDAEAAEQARVAQEALENPTMQQPKEFLEHLSLGLRSKFSLPFGDIAISYAFPASECTIAVL